MFRTLAALGIVAGVVFGLPGDAAAQKRMALVIGNSAYTKVPALANATNDAAAVEGLLTAAGFDLVRRADNVGLVELRRVLRDFSTRVADADIAVIFFAGHGIEVNGTNYLLPVDAVLEHDTDVEYESIALERVNQFLEPAKRLRLIILDACRDNPFVPSMKRTVASRSIGRGLAKVEVNSTDTLIAYAARAGSTAADGAGRNSPYTLALLNHMTTPGLDVRLALGRVRDEVLKSTNNKQEPFVYGSLGGAEIMLVGAKVAETAKQVDTFATKQVSEAAEAWDRVKDSTNVAMLQEYMGHYRDTFYAKAAGARIEELKVADAERKRLGMLQKEVDDAAKAEARRLLEAKKVEEARLELTRSLQAELKRVGCDPGAIDGKWSNKARVALREFVRLSKIAIAGDDPTAEALTAITVQKGRVCPLACRTDQIEANGTCIAKVAKKEAPPKKRSKEGPAQSKDGGTPMCYTQGKGFIVKCTDSYASDMRAF